MDSSFRESDTLKASTGFWAGLRTLASLINWLASLIRLTEEEWEDAGIYLDNPRGEKISISPTHILHRSQIAIVISYKEKQNDPRESRI